MAMQLPSTKRLLPAPSEESKPFSPPSELCRERTTVTDVNNAVAHGDDMISVPAALEDNGSNVWIVHQALDRILSTFEHSDGIEQHDAAPPNMDKIVLFWLPFTVVVMREYHHEHRILIRCVEILANATRFFACGDDEDGNDDILEQNPGKSSVTVMDIDANSDRDRSSSQDYEVMLEQLGVPSLCRDQPICSKLTCPMEQYMKQWNVGPLLLQALQRIRVDPLILSMILLALPRLMTFDEAKRAGLVSLLVQTLCHEPYWQDVSLICVTVQVIRACCDRSDFVHSLTTLHVVTALVHLLQHVNCEGIRMNVCQCLALIVDRFGHETGIQNELEGTDVIAAVMHAIKNDVQYAAVLEAEYALLHRLLQDEDELNSERVVQANGISAIARSMLLHICDPDVQYTILRAIFYLLQSRSSIVTASMGTNALLLDALRACIYQYADSVEYGIIATTASFAADTIRPLFCSIFIDSNACSGHKVRKFI